MMFAKPSEPPEKNVLEEALKAAKERLSESLGRLNRRLDREPPKNREND